MRTASLIPMTPEHYVSGRFHEPFWALDMRQDGERGLTPHMGCPITQGPGSWSDPWTAHVLRESRRDAPVPPRLLTAFEGVPREDMHGALQCTTADRALRVLRRGSSLSANGMRGRAVGPHKGNIAEVCALVRGIRTTRPGR
eukprot:74627-Chlamydomonas_euryale.AAC.20